MAVKVAKGAGLDAYKGGPWYKAISHKVVHDAIEAQFGIGLTQQNSETRLFSNDKGMLMYFLSSQDDSFMTQARDKIGLGIAPSILVLSVHNGRQPLEAFFGVSVYLDGKRQYTLITDTTTVSQRHTVNADIADWALKVQAHNDRLWQHDSWNEFLKTINDLQSPETNAVTQKQIAREYDHLSMIFATNPSRHSVMPFSYNERHMAPLLFGRCTTALDYIETAGILINQDVRLDRLVYRLYSFLQRSKIARPILYTLD